MMSATQAAAARTLVERRLTARCDVQVATDVAGVQNWDTVDPSDVPCQVGYPRQGGAGAMMDRLGNEPGAIIWVPVATQVKTGDRIAEQGTATTYEVVFVPPLRSDELLRGLTCIEIRTPGTVA